MAASEGSSVLDLMRTLIRHRLLTWELARREISDRYVGQLFGVFWLVGQPLIQMAVYLVTFGYVLGGRIDGGTGENYALFFLSGLVPWLTINEYLNKSVMVVRGNASLVKQVVFPLETLPIKTLLGSLFTQMFFLVGLMIFAAISHGGIPITFVAIPLLLLIQVIFLTGIGLAFSAVGTFVRDLREVMQLFSIVGLYLLPVVYSIESPSVPSILKGILYANPFTYVVWCWQDVFYHGAFEHPVAWIVSSLLAVGTLAMGNALFQRLKLYFGNVL
jgi:lipopolysaccharide transport system permease protein